MRASTLRALERAAELTRAGRLVDAMATAEPVVLAADEVEAIEIRQWLHDHTADFTGENDNRP